MRNDPYLASFIQRNMANILALLFLAGASGLSLTAPTRPALVVRPRIAASVYMQSEPPAEPKEEAPAGYSTVYDDESEPPPRKDPLSASMRDRLIKEQQGLGACRLARRLGVRVGPGWRRRSHRRRSLPHSLLPFCPYPLQAATPIRRTPSSPSLAPSGCLCSWEPSLLICRQQTVLHPLMPGWCLGLRFLGWFRFWALALLLPLRWWIPP